MPDVSSTAPADVDQWIVFDVHRNSPVAGVLPSSGGTPQVSALENAEWAIRRLIDRAGEASRLALAYQSFQQLRLTRERASPPGRGGARKVSPSV